LEAVALVAQPWQEMSEMTHNLVHLLSSRVVAMAVVQMSVVMAVLAVVVQVAVK
jgi:hypothetical protein